MDWAHPELLDLVPALLLAVIVTASASFGFALGATATVLTRIIIPTLITLHRKATK
jgi:hypothetical protein